MNSKYFLLLLIVLLTISPVFAGYFSDWYKWLRIPPEYSKAPDVLYFLILPFLGVFIIVWGLLTRIEIFGSLHRINMLLALIFAFSGIYYGWIFKVVHFLFSIGVFFTFVVFTIVFIVGLKLFAKKKINVTWKGSALRQLKAKEEELEDLREDLRNAPDDQKENIRTQIHAAEEQLRGLREEMERRPQGD